MPLDPISAGIGLVDTFINKFVGDKDLAAKLMAQARSEEFQGELSLLTGQMDINKEEAKSASVFVAGWRPFIGWVCGSALAYNFILYPIMVFAVTATMAVPTQFPKLDATELMPVLLGMLGLSGMRTLETIKGVARSSMK